MSSEQESFDDPLPLHWCCPLGGGLVDHEQDLDHRSRVRERSATALPEREVDAVLAERLFGLVVCTSTSAHEDGSYPRDNCHAFPDSPMLGGEDPLYSSTYEGMGLVLDRLYDGWTISIDATQQTISKWCVRLISRTDGSKRFMEFGQSMPMAVALAALAALSDEQPVEHREQEGESRDVPVANAPHLSGEIDRSPQVSRRATCPACGKTPWSGGKHDGCDFRVRHG